MGRSPATRCAAWSRASGRCARRSPHTTPAPSRWRRRSASRCSRSTAGWRRPRRGTAMSSSS